MALSATVLLTGCSNDETTEISESNAIAFNASTSNVTRGTATTTNSISAFKTYAFLGTDAYMDGVTVSKGTDSKWTAENTYFWPKNTLNFYSVSPSTLSLTTTGVGSGTTTPTISFTVPAAAESQTDLLYAVNIAPTSGQQVNVNFRHALSQIVFKAKNTNSALKVIINGVKIANLNNAGTYTYPNATTSSSSSDKGSWGSTLTGTETFVAGITETTLTGSSTATATNITADNGALFLLPQTQTAWVPADNQNPTGTYFLVNCKIYSVSGSNETLLWPATETFAEVAIPVGITWAEGNKYTYTFIFGEGGGYEPGTDDPVLVPITFDVTVDEFVDMSETEIDADTNSTSSTTE